MEGFRNSTRKGSIGSHTLNYVSDPIRELILCSVVGSFTIVRTFPFDNVGAEDKTLFIIN